MELYFNWIIFTRNKQRSTILTNSIDEQRNVNYRRSWDERIDHPLYGSLAFGCVEIVSHRHFVNDIRKINENLKLSKVEHWLFPLKCVPIKTDTKRCHKNGAQLPRNHNNKWISPDRSKTRWTKHKEWPMLNDLMQNLQQNNTTAAYASLCEMEIRALKLSARTRSSILCSCRGVHYTIFNIKCMRTHCLFLRFYYGRFSFFLFVRSFIYLYIYIQTLFLVLRVASHSNQY